MADAFTGGVEPGGLWSQNDVRILVCYLLSSVGAPLSRAALSQIVQEKGLANYFEVGDAVAALLAQGNLREEGDDLTVTESGREIAERLDASLPLSVRDKALEAALRLLAESRARRENRVTVTQGEDGCLVTCHISGGERDLMTVSLTVPDKRQAALVEGNFYRNPESVYRLLLSALTGDLGYARTLLEERT